MVTVWRKHSHSFSFLRTFVITLPSLKHIIFSLLVSSLAWPHRTLMKVTIKVMMIVDTTTISNDGNDDF